MCFHTFTLTTSKIGRTKTKKRKLGNEKSPLFSKTEELVRVCSRGN